MLEKEIWTSMQGYIIPNAGRDCGGDVGSMEGLLENNIESERKA
jgi:hypothetical protein